MFMVYGDDQKMIKCSTWKRRKRNKIRLIKAKVSNRFLFWHSRYHRGCECV
jgi:gluconate kinase